MENGTLFSTGNHPVETLVPMSHLRAAGFGFDIATVSGNPVKFELRAMPRDDEAITGPREAYPEQFRKPLKLSDVVAGLGPDSAYVAVFIPGGHGPLAGPPFSEDVAAVPRRALANDLHIVSIRHGPAAPRACAPRGEGDAFPFAGHTITAFPNASDRMTPEIGYMPARRGRRTFSSAPARLNHDRGEVDEAGHPPAGSAGRGRRGRPGAGA